MICENCTKKYSILYGSGRFCSQLCARSFSTKEKRVEINNKVSIRLNGMTKELTLYSCEKCSNNFESKKIRTGRKVHCNECKRKAPHSKNPTNIMELSLRTISKILKRANIKCGMCSWDKTSLDIHHVVERRNGGTDEDNNLAPLCPNCHRMAHEGKYTKEQLQTVTLNKVFKNWKEFYHPSN